MGIEATLGQTGRPGHLRQHRLAGAARIGQIVTQPGQQRHGLGNAGDELGAWRQLAVQDAVEQFFVDPGELAQYFGADQAATALEGVESAPDDGLQLGIVGALAPDRHGLAQARQFILQLLDEDFHHLRIGGLAHDRQVGEGIGIGSGHRLRFGQHVHQREGRPGGVRPLLEDRQLGLGVHLLGGLQALADAGHFVAGRLDGVHEHGAGQVFLQRPGLLVLPFLFVIETQALGERLQIEQGPLHAFRHALVGTGQPSQQAIVQYQLGLCSERLEGGGLGRLGDRQPDVLQDLQRIQPGLQILAAGLAGAVQHLQEHLQRRHDLRQVLQGVQRQARLLGHRPLQIGAQAIHQSHGVVDLQQCQRTAHACQIVGHVCQCRGLAPLGMGLHLLLDLLDVAQGFAHHSGSHGPQVGRLGGVLAPQCALPADLESGDGPFHADQHLGQTRQRFRIGHLAVLQQALQLVVLLSGAIMQCLQLQHAQRVDQTRQGGGQDTQRRHIVLGGGVGFDLVLDVGQILAEGLGHGAVQGTVVARHAAVHGGTLGRAGQVLAQEVGLLHGGHQRMVGPGVAHVVEDAAHQRGGNLGREFLFPQLEEQLDLARHLAQQGLDGR